MLHETVVSVVPVTEAVKFCVLPRSSEAAAGLTVMLMEVGGGAVGGGSTEPVIPPPHPAVLAAIARRARIGRAGIPRGGTCRGTVFCERGRMHSEMQANGQPYGRRSAEILFCSKPR